MSDLRESSPSHDSPRGAPARSGGQAGPAKTQLPLGPLERLLSALEGTGVLVTGADGRVRSWNGAAAATTGLSAGQVEGRLLGEVFRASSPGDLERAWNGAEPLRVEGHFEGDPVTRVLQAVPLSPAEGGPDVGGIAWTFLARPPELHASDERFLLMVDAVEDYAIFMLDPDGRVATWNEGARRIKGYRDEEILGAHLSRFYPEAERVAGTPERLLEQARRFGRVEHEGWRVRKDGRLFWADVVITALRDAHGTLVGYTKVTRDLTARREAEERLRQSEERFRLLVASVKDYAIFMLDPEGRVATWNAGAEALKGYQPDEIIGSHISRFYPPETAATLPRRLLATALAEGRVEDEGWRVRKDGTRFWADVILTVLRDSTGRHLGFAKVTRDLSDRREAEEQLRQNEERFRLMLDAVKDYAVFMLDPSGRVATWNTGAERIKGYAAHEILGKSVECFYPEEERGSGKVERELEIARREGRFEDEGWRVRKDGSRFWANVVLSAVRNSSGTLLGFTKITRDLTDQRRLEDERLRLAQATESIRMRDEFLSIASHELKTPLTSLQLQLDSLADRARAQDPKLYARLERARRNGERLTDLIETLLDVSRIATGRFELKRETVDLPEVAQEVVDRMAEAAARAQNTVTLDAEGTVVGEWDRLRIEQLLMNLLSNAFKYAAGTAVRVSVKREGSQAALEVSDRGPGIPEADLTRIFGRFERAAPMRHYGGLGLGLYVNQQIAQAHGGTIVGRNLPGGGVAFRVVLPLTALGSTGAHHQSEEGAP